jgi:transcriptional regulator with XRE-family HTH domain
MRKSGYNLASRRVHGYSCSIIITRTAGDQEAEVRRVKTMSLRDWRESAGLTQRELARLARIARASISHIENGYYPPTAGFAGKVCRALSAQLGCTLHTWELFPGVFRAPLLPDSAAQAQGDVASVAAAPATLLAGPAPAPTLTLARSPEPVSAGASRILI